MRYLVDTVAIVRHFTRNPNMGRKAKAILGRVRVSDDTIAISIVSLMEILYLSEKGRISIDLRDALDRLNASAIYEIVDLSPAILLVAESVEFYELHDRLILATSKYLDIPIISSDSRFPDVAGVRTIWD